MGYKVSYKQIKEFIEVRSNTGCKIITNENEYINTNQKISIMCKCGNKFETSYRIFSRKINPTQQCKQCGLNNRISKRTKSIDKINDEIKAIFGNEFKIVGNYENVNKKVEIRHICGYTWKSSLTNFKRSKGCPKCNKTCKDINTTSFKEEVKRLTSNEYQVIGEYTNAITKIEMKHNICNRNYTVTPHDFLSGGRCSMCWKENRFGKLQKDTKSFKEEVYNKYGDEYIVLSDYIGARTKLKIKHETCNNTYLISPDNILRGKKCPYCSGHTPYNTERFKEKINKLYPNEYTILGEYKTMHSKILIRHNKCGHEWKIEANALVRCQGSCPKCIQSIGERAIAKILEVREINYKNQYTLKGCKNKKLLPFDFAILDNKNKLKYLIEYDGEQHFYPVNFGGRSDEESSTNFASTVYNDAIKNSYCEDNNILLLRIPYWEFDNIEEIIDKYFSKGIINLNF